VGVPAARVVHQHLTHQPGRDRKEMRAILEAEAAGIHEAQVGLVDQGRRLKRVTGLFATQVSTRHSPQIGIHQRQQAVERDRVAPPPFRQ